MKQFRKPDNTDNRLTSSVHFAFERRNYHIQSDGILVAHLNCWSHVTFVF